MTGNYDVAIQGDTCVLRVVLGVRDCELDDRGSADCRDTGGEDEAGKTIGLHLFHHNVHISHNKPRSEAVSDDGEGIGKICGRRTLELEIAAGNVAQSAHVEDGIWIIAEGRDDQEEEAEHHGLNLSSTFSGE
jgi:hypothetical protein